MERGCSQIDSDILRISARTAEVVSTSARESAAAPARACLTIAFPVSRLKFAGRDKPTKALLAL
jgi:hypothetical protein